LLQPLVDEGSKYHLEAHHTLELARRLAREDPSTVQQGLGENEHGPCLVREHRYFRLQRAGRRSHAAVSPDTYVTYIRFISYILIKSKARRVKSADDGRRTATGLDSNNLGRH
jgi:hypothetical protein